MDLFRALPSRSGAVSSIGQREKAILAPLALLVIAPAWSLGGYGDFALLTFVTLSLSAFTLLFVPYFPEDTKPEENLKKLFRFFPFWMGIFFLLYVLFQGINPSYSYVRGDKGWWLLKISHISWLPSGVDSPFSQNNPFRMLVVYTSVFFVMCTVWVGLRSTRSIRMLFWVLILNGFAFSLLAIFQRGMGVKKILGIYNSPVSTFLGTFYYRNHATAFLYLIMAVILGLLWYYMRKSKIRGKRSGPHFLCAFVLLFVLAAIALSFSRSGVIAVVYIGSIFLVSSLISFAKGGEWGLRLGVLAILMIAFVAGYYVTLSPKAEAMWQRRYQKLVHDLQNYENDERYLLMDATWGMYKDHYVFGTGAGSFMYRFPDYQEKLDRGKKRRYFYRHAHSDVFQILAEFGFVGAGLLLSGFMYFVYQAIRNIKCLSGLPFMAYVGISMFLIHSIYEFVFQNPSLLITFMFILSLSVRYHVLSARKMLHEERL